MVPVGGLALTLYLQETPCTFEFPAEEIYRFTEPGQSVLLHSALGFPCSSWFTPMSNKISSYRPSWRKEQRPPTTFEEPFLSLLEAEQGLPLPWSEAPWLEDRETEASLNNKDCLIRIKGISDSSCKTPDSLCGVHSHCSVTLIGFSFFSSCGEMLYPSVCLYEIHRAWPKVGLHSPILGKFSLIVSHG